MKKLLVALALFSIASPAFASAGFQVSEAGCSPVNGRYCATATHDFFDNPVYSNGYAFLYDSPNSDYPPQHHIIFNETFVSGLSDSSWYYNNGSTDYTNGGSAYGVNHDSPGPIVEETTCADAPPPSGGGEYSTSGAITATRSGGLITSALGDWGKMLLIIMGAVMVIGVGILIVRLGYGYIRNLPGDLGYDPSRKSRRGKKYDSLRGGSGDNLTQDQIKRQFPLM